jgi:hypothetical protein
MVAVKTGLKGIHSMLIEPKGQEKGPFYKLKSSFVEIFGKSDVPPHKTETTSVKPLENVREN